MATTTSTINPGQDSEERKLGTSEHTRALSPTARIKNTHPNNTPESSPRSPQPPPPFSPPRVPPQTPQRDGTRGRANHNDKNNPSGKSFIGKMEFIDTLIHEIDETDPRNAVTMLPSQVRKMAAKNQPQQTQPSSPLKKSTGMPFPDKATLPASPPQMSLEPSEPSPVMERKLPARPPRPHPVELNKSTGLSEQPTRFHSTRERIIRDQPTPVREVRDQTADDQTTHPDDQSIRGQLASSDQLARDPLARFRKDSPEPVRPTAPRRNSLNGVSRALLAQTRLPQSPPPPPPFSLVPSLQTSSLPPPPSPPISPLPLLDSMPPLPDDVVIPRARPGFVPLPPPPTDSHKEARKTPQRPPPPPPIDLPNKEGRASPQKFPPLSPTGLPSKDGRASPQKLPPPPALPQDPEFPANFGSDKKPDPSSYIPRYLPSPPPLNPSNLTNVYSALPPPPPLPATEKPLSKESTSGDKKSEKKEIERREKERKENEKKELKKREKDKKEHERKEKERKENEKIEGREKLRSSAGDAVHRDRDTLRKSRDSEADEIISTQSDDGFKFAKGTNSLKKASQIQISTVRTSIPPSSPELSHSLSAPSLLLHDLSSSPLSSPSVLSPLSSPSSPPSSPPSSFPLPLTSPASSPPLASPLSSDTPPALPVDPADQNSTYEQRMRKKLIAEIVTTEIDYVKDLELTIAVYLHPLRASNMLSEDQIHTLFSDLEILLSFNKILKTELEKQHSLADPAAMKIGAAFLTMSPFLKLYSAYCSNQPIAFKALDEYKKANPHFTKFITDAAYDRCKGLFLSSYLIKPVQRVCKYPLFLKDLLKYTPKDHVDYPGLVEAESMINAVVQSINEYKRALESYHAVAELANIMEGIDDLVTPTRKFVADVDIMCCFDINGMQKPRRLHLFNDILLICKKRETRQLLQSKRLGWKVKDRVDLSAARLISLSIESLNFALEISCENSKKFILLFLNDVQWNKWTKLLKDQIIQNKVATHTRRGLLLSMEHNSAPNLKTKT